MVMSFFFGNFGKIEQVWSLATDDGDTKGRRPSQSFLGKSYEEKGGGSTRYKDGTQRIFAQMIAVKPRTKATWNSALIFKRQEHSSYVPLDSFVTPPRESSWRYFKTIKFHSIEISRFTMGDASSFLDKSVLCGNH